MVAFSSLVIGLSAIAASLAAPLEFGPEPLEERGPFNFFLGPDHPLNPRGNLTARSNTNYNQDYTTGGTVQYTPGTNQFSVTWNTQKDFVVGVGWKPGNNAPVTFSGSFDVKSGLGSLSLYGWSTNPLVEYYVIEANQGVSSGGTQKGTFTSDGGTYTIWEHQQTNKPSIEGTSTFQQYVSVRNSQRTSGTITLENHIKAWASHGMNLGSLNFQVIAVESWSGSGSASQKVTRS